jgi:hypothetical protein
MSGKFFGRFAHLIQCRGPSLVGKDSDVMMTDSGGHSDFEGGFFGNV